MLQCDELWSFVKSKEQQAWLWSAMDVETRRILCVHIGGRTKEDAQKLVNKLHPSFKDVAYVDTDGLASYIEPLEDFDHTMHPDKGSGMLNYIERFHLTLRHLCARLRRKGLGFSKSWDNHKGAIYAAIKYYNKTFAKSLAGKSFYH